MAKGPINIAALKKQQEEAKKALKALQDKEKEVFRACAAKVGEYIIDLHKTGLLKTLPAEEIASQIGKFLAEYGIEL